MFCVNGKSFAVHVHLREETKESVEGEVMLKHLSTSTLRRYTKRSNILLSLQFDKLGKDQQNMELMVL